MAGFLTRSLLTTGFPGAVCFVAAREADVFPDAGVLATTVRVAATFLVEGLRAAGFFFPTIGDAAIFRVTAFPVLAAALAAPARAAFGFVAAAGDFFGRATFTSPRMERPDASAFSAVAFTRKRRVGLLRWVAVMGTTLGVVGT